jgi:hypothetical protein
MTFKILFGIDALAGAVILYFFFVGLADGSVSSFNMGLWAAILAALAAILGGGYALNANGWTTSRYSFCSYSPFRARSTPSLSCWWS